MTSSDSAWLNVFSALAVAGCIIVVIGVVLEGAELLVRFRGNMQCRRWVVKVFGKERRRTLIFCAKYVKPRLFWPFEIMAFAVLVLGLVVELFGSFAAERVQSKENAQLESTNTFLSLRIEELRKQNNELERETWPRWQRLNPTKFAEAINGRPKMNVEILYPPDNVEAYEFAYSINTALSVWSHWEVLDIRPYSVEDIVEPFFRTNKQLIKMPLGMRLGNGFEFDGFLFEANNSSPTLSSGTNSAIESFIFALRASGISWIPYSVDTDPKLPDNVLKIIVPQ